ncbi:unnamed protein product, partial [Rotaria sp. Silwood2]
MTVNSIDSNETDESDCQEWYSSCSNRFEPCHVHSGWEQCIPDQWQCVKRRLRLYRPLIFNDIGQFPPFGLFFKPAINRMALNNITSSTETSIKKKYRDKKKFKNLNGHQSSYKCCQSLGKALKRAVNSLPKDTNKRIMVVQHLAQNLNIISKTTHQHTRQQRSLSIELKELVIQFYQRDDITYQLPGKRDYVTVTDDNGKSMTLQKRILLYNIRETYQLFVNEYSNKNVDLSLTSFNELRPVNILIHSYMPHRSCLCIYHENVDFSENFRLCMQNAVQNSYYSQDAVSLFTAYVWYAGGGGESFVYISNNLTHDKYCVNASTDNLFEQLTQRFQHLQQIHILSDGSSQQFKQKFLFRNVCRFSQQHK